jgi:SAM-dependent methyltransferase
MWNCHLGNSNYEIVEREDGFIDPASALQYFASYADWPAHEREGITRVRGRALDIGCGAGRVSLYLQEQGHEVLAIDNSPMAVKTARARGVKSARVLDVRDIGTLKGPFDTIVMYGNNFALLGSPERARRLLAIMDRITTADGRIVGSGCNPYQTKEPAHLAYHQLNRRRGRLSGQLRLRIRFEQYIGPWFDYMFVSPEEVRKIVAGTGWKLSELVPGRGPLYVVVLEKRRG